MKYLHLYNLQQLDISNTAICESSGLKFFPPSTLQSWQSQLKGITKLHDARPLAHDTQRSEVDDFNCDIEDSMLEPVLTTLDMIPNIDDSR
jgi:hypothetical protein